LVAIRSDEPPNNAIGKLLILFNEYNGGVL
jgi:hypothetical protein